MPRTVVQDSFNGGLDLTTSPALIGPNRCHRAENVVYTRRSVKRRLGKRVAYRNVTASANAVALLKRFYKLATTGSISKFFFKYVAGALWKADSDWGDATDYAATEITAFTQITLPATSNNSLYGNYSSTGATCAGGQSFASKSWCYFVPTPSSADDAAKTFQVGIRTDGTKAYLMGLVPPASLAIADVVGVNTVPASNAFVGQDIDAAAPDESGPGCLRLGSDGRVHAAYVQAATGTPYYNVRSAAGVWGTPEQASATVGGTTYGSMSMDIDADGKAHIAFYASGATELRYATNKSGSWTSELVDTAGSVGLYNSLVIDNQGLPHILYSDATTPQLSHISRGASGTWSSITQVDTAAGFTFQPVAAFDSTGRIHVVYGRTDGGANQDIYYAVRSAAGVWGAGAAVEATADNLAYPVAMALDSSNNPGILYSNSTDTDTIYAKYDGATWTAEIADSAGAYDSKAIDFDANDVAYIAYEDNNVVYHKNRHGGSWSSRIQVATLGTPQSLLGLVIAPDFSIHLGNTAATTVEYAKFTRYLYKYRLTAEYDNAVLGESRPADALSVGYEAQVSGASTHVLDLDDAGARYDMTDDVTRINVYRTVSGGSTYYRVGFVTCSSGAPTADFTDNVSDADLVSEPILDDDKYMPPKFKTGVIWKDRAVIANTKCRNTGATAGDLDSLDLGESQVTTPASRSVASIHKNRIRFSDAFHPDIFRAGFFQDILPDGDSGSINRLIVNPKIDALFVFMENDVVALLDPVGDLVSTLSFRPKNIANSKGTPAPNSVVEHDGMLFYWTKTGIEVISGFEGRNITSKSIGPLWRMLDSAHPRYADRVNMAQIHKVCGVVDPKEERIYWAYPSGGNTYNNRIMCFDYGLWRDSGYREGIFSIFTGWDISCFEVWGGEGDKNELFGGEANATDGHWIYRLNYGNFDENGDASPAATNTDVAISSYFYPGISTYGSERYKAFKSASVELVTGVTNVTVKLDVDHEKTLDTLATVSWPDGSKAQRKNFGLPRTAIGVRSGLRFEVVDPAGGPAGWELVDVATALDDLPTRMRP